MFWSESEDGVWETKRQVGGCRWRRIEAGDTVRLKSPFLRKWGPRGPRCVSLCFEVVVQTLSTWFHLPFRKSVTSLILETCWGKWSALENGVIDNLAKAQPKYPDFPIDHSSPHPVWEVRAAAAVQHLCWCTVVRACSSCFCKVSHRHTPHFTCGFDIYKKLQKVLQISSQCGHSCAASRFIPFAAHFSPFCL